MTTTEPSCPPLTLASHPDDPVTLAFAGVIAQSMKAQRQPLIRGLNEDGFRRLSFPALTAGTHGDAMETWLAHAIATAAMCENHLWQDKGLPNRKVLAALMQKYFPSLAALNNKDMKWKKFF